MYHGPVTAALIHFCHYGKCTSLATHQHLRTGALYCAHHVYVNTWKYNGAFTCEEIKEKKDHGQV